MEFGYNIRNNTVRQIYVVLVVVENVFYGPHDEGIESITILSVLMHQGILSFLVYSFKNVPVLPTSYDLENSVKSYLNINNEVPVPLYHEHNRFTMNSCYEANCKWHETTYSPIHVTHGMQMYFTHILSHPKNLVVRYIWIVL